MAKRMGAVRIALTYAGCMIGAGFVSGQELWQYFGAYGKNGVISLVLSFAILGAATLALTLLSRKAGVTNMEDLLLAGNHPLARNLLGDAAALIIFSNVSIMIAGIGALAEQSTGIPRAVTNLVVTAAIGCCSCFGIGGMMTVFDILVPLLVVSTLALCGVRLGKTGLSGITFPDAGAVNPMLGGWGLASVNYAAMNYFGVLTVFPPIAQKTGNKHTLTAAISIGTAMLIASGLGITLTLSASGDAVMREIPMQQVAEESGRAAGVTIALMLFAAMFGVGVSYQVSAMSYLEGRIQNLHKLPTNIALLALSYALSLVGFGDLISFLYPVFGYFGMGLILLIAYRCAAVYRNSRNHP